MTDRFKFRVFDKQTGKYYKTRISKGSGCMVYQHPASSHCVWIQIGTMFAELERDEKTYALTELEPDFIIEQCTGLKDKNGNLIYEGDILLLRNNKFEVGSNNITVFFKCLTDEYTHIDPMDFDYNESEIIGNIHKQVE